jgi:hypothetical protein
MPESNTSSSAGARASCPECGASVPIVAGRWLHVHREGSAEYAYPRGSGPRRCPGSLLPVSTSMLDPSPDGH